MSDLHKNFKEPAKRMASTWIKAELKAAFPGVKFSCRESRGTGSAVYVDWTDGPFESDVKDVVYKYQAGHFDGMTDCYEYGNSRNDIPQVRFVFTKREVSRQLYQEYADLLEASQGEKILLVEKTYPSGGTYVTMAFADGRNRDGRGDEASWVLHRFMQDVEEGRISDWLPVREEDTVPVEVVESIPAPLAPEPRFSFNPTMVVGGGKKPTLIETAMHDFIRSQIREVRKSR